MRWLRGGSAGSMPEWDDLRGFVVIRAFIHSAVLSPHVKGLSVASQTPSLVRHCSDPWRVMRPSNLHSHTQKDQNTKWTHSSLPTSNDSSKRQGESQTAKVHAGSLSSSSCWAIHYVDEGWRDSKIDRVWTAFPGGGEEESTKLAGRPI